ncbi:uncharacterized protein LOC135464925 [Liolophura sinensis]|uniref:uncharacterized protein LOC135464925 n=1 Tax=Liolophura sinensis TaxID=3198878 RepID=UPI003157F249
MGKVKRGRQKLHTAAKKSKTKEGHSTKGDVMVVDVVENMQTDIPRSPFLTPNESANPFSGVTINKATLTQNLPDFDARSTITSKSFKGLGIKKKEKRKVRHQLWMEKMNAAQSEVMKKKERKRKSKTAVVGDLTDLQETLPTLELLMKKSTGKPQDKPKVKTRGIEKEAKRQKRTLEGIAMFNQVLSHPAYKENPTETIAIHLHNKMQQSETDS